MGEFFLPRKQVEIARKNSTASCRESTSDALQPELLALSSAVSGYGPNKFLTHISTSPISFCWSVPDDAGPPWGRGFYCCWLRKNTIFIVKKQVSERSLPYECWQIIGQKKS
jgi:hypothetical protein